MTADEWDLRPQKYRIILSVKSNLAVNVLIVLVIKLIMFTKRVIFDSISNFKTTVT